MVNAITIAHHHDLTSVLDEYVQDDDYASIVAKLTKDIPHERTILSKKDLYYIALGFVLQRI